MILTTNRICWKRLVQLLLHVTWSIGMGAINGWLAELAGRMHKARGPEAPSLAAVLLGA